MFDKIEKNEKMAMALVKEGGKQKTNVVTKVPDCLKKKSDAKLKTNLSCISTARLIKWSRILQQQRWLQKNRLPRIQVPKIGASNVIKY
jgi:gamma-glutamyl phosphate reductase